jgi:hypothetical protein
MMMPRLVIGIMWSDQILIWYCKGHNWLWFKTKQQKPYSFGGVMRWEAAGSGFTREWEEMWNRWRLTGMRGWGDLLFRWEIRTCSLTALRHSLAHNGMATILFCPQPSPAQKMVSLFLQMPRPEAWSLLKPVYLFTRHICSLMLLPFCP